MRSAFFLSLLILPAVHCEKAIGENVVGLLGIPYAEAPIGGRRFTESSPASFPEGASFDNWPSRCFNLDNTEGTSEDCLYVSLLRHKESNEKTSCLLIITNDNVDEKIVTSLVKKDLSVAVAGIRDGVLGSFGNAPFGVSDVVSLVSFLRANGDRLLIDHITVWAEGSLAETVASAMPKIEVTRVILINGNAATRTYDREKFAARASYKLRTDTMCDLPSFSQSLDCLRSKPIDKLLEATKQLVKSFEPFGDPFRAPREHVPEKSVPTILGLYKGLGPEYPGVYQFDGAYDYKAFKRFLAGLIPDSLHQNAPLLRRLVLHQYIYSTGPKQDVYHLFQQMITILRDRDVVVPTQRMIEHLMTHKNRLWVMEYGIDNPYRTCLQEGVEEANEPFCARLLEYFTRFAAEGSPTSNSCDPKNPTFPMLGSSKRDYFVILQANGIPEWEFNFHRPACELWNNLMPSMDTLELVGRRDVIFAEETEVDPLQVEDDVQMWHSTASEDDTELTEEQALNDMPHHAEL